MRSKIRIFLKEVLGIRLIEDVFVGLGIAAAIAAAIDRCMSLLTKYESAKANAKILYTDLITLIRKL